MTRWTKLATKLVGAAAGLALLVPADASAHAFLDHAVPGVGATVGASPGELELAFTEDVVIALSGVRVTSASGAAVPTAKPTLDAASKSVLHVRLGHALTPGVYMVHWHVVATDTHPTSGTYKFTVGT